MSVFLDHLGTTYRDYVAEKRCKPAVLALGRWDARELAQLAADYTGGVTSAPKPSALFRAARDGAYFDGVPIKVDTRIGRMPGALWWHP